MHIGTVLVGNRYTYTILHLLYIRIIIGIIRMTTTTRTRTCMRNIEEEDDEGSEGCPRRGVGRRTPRPHAGDAGYS